ncbi:putative transcription factor C3H family [Lupinus albus]|uniref:Putative transcription factor C3H family n=1 Tax=Lupinus albus TaxID=3870 RepID=A0A6A4NT78_LUPAL|nr:putative transcription factor C3H family [Lupinus albus]
MAEHLASIFGTEKDRVNCPFYFKIGACRHGDRCSRLHTKPTISPTILLSNMYQRPDMNININLNVSDPDQPPQSEPPQSQSSLDPDKVQEHFEDFYQDLFEELSKYGQIQSLNICDNLADHMVGNVYVQFKEEDHAANALMNLTGRFYSGRPIIVDFSPVTDFREATCRQYEENVCNRGGYCNFMHLKKISRELRKQLFGRNKRWNDRGGSRSRSPPRSRAYEEHSHSGRGSGRRDVDRYHDSRDRRPRSRSPRRREKRSRSPMDRNARRARESSAERRAKIEQWNREKEQQESGNKNNTNSNDHDEQGAAQNGSESGDH